MAGLQLWEHIRRDGQPVAAGGQGRRADHGRLLRRRHLRRRHVLHTGKTTEGHNRISRLPKTTKLQKSEFDNSHFLIAVWQDRGPGLDQRRARRPRGHHGRLLRRQRLGGAPHRRRRVIPRKHHRPPTRSLEGTRVNS